MNTTHRRAKESRCASELAPLQEDALIGLMFDNFAANKYKHLDYDKVRHYAFELQTDEVICASMDTTACGEGEVWLPPDEWITDMCRAFLAHSKEQSAKDKSSAFGGGRETDYDPKNPFGGSKRSSSPARGGSPARAKPSARKSPGARSAAKSNRGQSHPHRPSKGASNNASIELLS